jgi:uncharacterized protein (DUF1499 family)
MLLPMIARAVATACSASYILFSAATPSLADTGFDARTTILKACPPQRNCVSSNYREPPNRYLSPLQLVNDRDIAFRRAVRDLSEMTIAEIDPNNHYIHLTVPGTAPGSLDDVELVFAGTIVNVRCEARVTLPPPPFCLQKNCISGNMDQRTRADQVARTLGLPPSDQLQMQKAKWTPIFFNADRVPGFDEDDY